MQKLMEFVAVSEMESFVSVPLSDIFGEEAAGLSVPVKKGMEKKFKELCKEHRSAALELGKKFAD